MAAHSAVSRRLNDMQCPKDPALVADLFDAYLADGAMPGRWAEAWRRSNDETGRARIVCDFVAGMTDPYAIEQHAALFDAKGRLG